ncbi:hypothetical protein [Fundidesulfovibrio soli]|uniref:hypothetical protein n=1 Tax=Fundidesulfovibrio soli TaxID=2922716 RepID=UPI001FAED69A|nr:hypothetical protein [Fundidesulfovibrio soli]
MIRRLFWLLFAFSLAGLCASSLALFAGPSSEVALWSEWTFLGLSRPRWEALHYGMGLLTVLGGLGSLLAGGRRMMALEEEERSAAPSWVLAVMTFFVVMVASVLKLPPGGTLVNLSASLKAWHAKSFGEPPIAGAASMTPTDLAKRLSLDPAKALTNLALHNVKLSSPDATLQEIARKNGLAPAAVYETLRGGKEPKAPTPPPVQTAEVKTPPPAPQLPADPPPGLGRLKLSDVCEQYGLNLSTAVEKLTKAGIKASPEMTLRQIAQSNLMLPIEVYDALRGVPPKASEPAPAPAPAPAPTPAAPQASASAPAPVPSQPGHEQPVAQTPGVIPVPEGLERMTLSAFCREHGIDTQQAQARLKARGIVAFSDMTFRELAIENNLTPEQVMDLVVK